MVSAHDTENLMGLCAAFDPPLLLNQQQAEFLLTFVSLLKRWNSVHNLTAIRDGNEIVNKHIIDSLSAARFLPPGSVLDVGSGGGFPGIPLAVLKPKQSFTLVDSNQKKTSFLKEVKRKLALTNVTVISTRVEQLDQHKDYTGPYNTIICRAYASIAQIVHQTHNWLAIDGSWLLMKGKDPCEELNEVDPAYRLSVDHCTMVKLPGLDAQRHMLQLSRRNTS